MDKERREKEKQNKTNIEKESIENKKLKEERAELERLLKKRFKERIFIRERPIKPIREIKSVGKKEIKNEILEKETIKGKKEEKSKESEKKIQKKNFELIIKLQEIQTIIANHINKVKSQENFCKNFKLFIDEFASDINDINNKLYIAIKDSCENKKTIEPNKKKLFIEIDNLYTKFKKFNSILDEINNNTQKKIENKYKFIHDNFNEIINSLTQFKPYLKSVFELKIEVIKKTMEDLNILIEELKNNEYSYEELKKEIESNIISLQNKGKEFCEEVNKIIIERIKYINQKIEMQNNQKDEELNNPKIDKKFLRNSLLLGIDEFSISNDIFSSKLLFNDNNNIDLEKHGLLKRNWKEICLVYEDYDLHDINFELKAVGLKPKHYFYKASVEFKLNTLIEILEFEIDGKKSSYNYDNSSIIFDIKLFNLEYNKIHLKYKESKKDLSEGEKKERKLYRVNWYGISKKLKGQNAIFTLILKCDYEIICFGNGILTKTNENEYKWGGVVPHEGKKILVKMSRKTAKFAFNVISRIESLDKTFLKNIKLTDNDYFKGGNNEINKIEALSNQTKKIQYKEEKRKYEIDFINTNSYYGEFNLKGELTNRCKGEWICNLTKEQIEEEIPDDYKMNKENFRQIAINIIKNYDEKNENDSIEVPDFVKIGKWIYNNLKYDSSYSGKNKISATEIYNIRCGVCHHFTILYNALLYSLGYQCIYVSGYAIKGTDSFNENDGHAWSLIKVNDKWLPFDATWGIFSGKLPVCHVFGFYFQWKRMASGSKKIKFTKYKVQGNFIE